VNLKEKLKEKLTSWIDSLSVFLIGNSAVALALAALGLDRGFLSQFLTARGSNPVVVALLSAAFASALASAFLYQYRETMKCSPGEVMEFLFGFVLLALFVRGFLTICGIYIPILSPLTLAPILWSLWPASVSLTLSAGPLRAWSSNPAVQLGLIGLALSMYYIPYEVARVGINYWRQRRERDIKLKREAEEKEMKFKGARTTADYVARVASIPDRKKAINMLRHDMEVAMKYGDITRANEMLKALHYIELQDALGLPLKPEDADCTKRIAEDRKRKQGEAGGPAPWMRPGGQDRRRLLNDLESLKVFEGVVGLEDVKREIVWRFLLPLFFPEEAEGVKPSGGILLYGPTGTGKTEVMRRLLGACRRLGIQVLEAKPSDLVSMWVGETERNIRRLFEKARERPTVIFIDEADGLLAQREGWEGSHEQRALKEFLQQMDGIRENEKVLVIACTNEPWRIAEPVLRPGRLGVHFYAPPPGHGERAELFRLFLRGRRVEGEIDYGRLAEITAPSRRGYYCGADIKAICERAQIIALQNGRKALTMADLEAAAARTQPSISAAAVRAFEDFMGRYTPINSPSPPSEYVR